MDEVQIIQIMAAFVRILKNLIVYAIIIRVIMSWFTFGQHEGGRGKISQIIHDITDPFINLARKIPHRIGMIDLSPLIAMFAIDILGEFLADLILSLLN